MAIQTSSKLRSGRTKSKLVLLLLQPPCLLLIASHALMQVPYTHGVCMVRTGSGRSRRDLSLVARNSKPSRRCSAVNAGFNDAQQALLSPKEATCAAVNRRLWAARRRASVGSAWRWMFLVVVLLMSQSSVHTCTAAAAASKTYYSGKWVCAPVSIPGSNLFNESRHDGSRDGASQQRATSVRVAHDMHRS